MDVLMKSFLYLLVIIWPAYSAAQNNVTGIEKWSRFEITLQGPSSGNPFSDTHISATFTHGNDKRTVNGFYDGDGKYIIRFMPDKEGIWNYTTSSNTRSLHNKKGSFNCVAATGENHGPVKVWKMYNF